MFFLKNLLEFASADIAFVVESGGMLTIFLFSFIGINELTLISLNLLYLMV